MVYEIKMILATEIKRPSGLGLHDEYLAALVVAHSADQRSAWLSPCILLSVAAGESRNNSPCDFSGRPGLAVATITKIKISPGTPVRLF